MLTSFKNKDIQLIDNWRRNTGAIDKFRFLHHFLPHVEKKQRSPLLSKKALFAYCVAIVVVSLFFRLLPKTIPGVLGYSSSISTNQLLYYTNYLREQAEVKPLRINKKLTLAAREKAADMFKNDYWAHVSPSGADPWGFILKEGYDYVYAGENLAKNFSTAKDAVDAWYNSPSHKENLLSPNYYEMGFAVATGVLDGYETTLVVQMFGRPRDLNLLATEEEEKQTLAEDAAVKLAFSESSKTLGESVKTQPVQSGKFLSLEHISFVDVGVATRVITLTLALFVFLLFTLDVWYSKKMGIVKFTGHTLVHILLFVTVILSIWFVLKPGVVL